MPRVAMIVDVSKAHKRVRLRHRDQGLMFFEVAGQLFYYVVCHFGGAFPIIGGSVWPPWSPIFPMV